jgi:molecular chaperone GrpE (heat shock protein)
VPLIKLLIRIKKLAEKLENSLFPVVDNLNHTVSKLNSEIASINEITQNVGSIILQLEKVIKLARILVTSPVIKIISTFSGMMQAMASDGKNKKDKSKED